MTIPAVSAPRWQVLGLCYNRTDIDFTSTDPEEEAVVADFCEGCPVLQDCLRFAVENNCWDNTYGGLTSMERREYYRREYQSYMWFPADPSSMRARVLELLMIEPVVSANGKAIKVLSQRIQDHWQLRSSDSVRLYSNVERTIHRMQQVNQLGSQMSAAGTVALWSLTNGAPRPDWLNVSSFNTPQSEKKRRNNRSFPLATRLLEKKDEEKVCPVLDKSVAIQVVPDLRPLAVRIMESLHEAKIVTHGHATRILAEKMDETTFRIELTLGRLRRLGYVLDDSEGDTPPSRIRLSPVGRAVVLRLLNEPV
jgi:hypothetical protein